MSRSTGKGMLSQLSLQFLGLPQLQLDGRSLSTDRRKAIALLSYLAVNDIGHTRQRYSRESLSALFWPDYEQAKAFSNLRRTIWEVRQAIGERWLIADRDALHLNENAEIDLDVARFQDLLSQSRQQRDLPLRIPLLRDAVRLYRDHFLTGFSLKDAPNFNDWAFAEAEDLRRQLAGALTMLSEDLCTLGQAVQAIPYARRLVSLDQLNEVAHRQLMEVYLRAGQHSAALKQYQACEQILRKELGVDPQPETHALYKKIRKGEIKPRQIDEDVKTLASKAPEAHSLPTGTVTFLFTDIEGSTDLARQYPDAIPGLLERHHEILNQSIQMHHGYLFQVAGDSIAAAFHAAGDALHAALDAQRLLHNEAWTPVPIKVRMGIHTGAAQIQEASQALRYSGYATLALTQRIMATGYGGQVLVSEAVRDLTRGLLPKGVELRQMGEYRFKDFAGTEQIYQLVVPGLVSDFPPLRTFDAHPNNLPVQLSKFIGREKEQAEITDLIAGNRLVTLLGVGGIGKTRLSLESARQVLNAFPGGVWFIELASLSDPERVPQTVFRTLGLIEQPGRSHLEILTDFLRSKRALLILDNCEHLIQACAQLVQNILHSCPDLHILATSREALGIPGEMSYLVPTLSTPDPLQTTLETLPDYEAAQLFIDRAQSALPDFRLTEHNLSATAQLCHHLDGIPLAIELAAARVKLLSVEEIAARLDDRFRLLTGGARTALPRHQTLLSLIDWSHDLLSEPERVLLRRLSIFAGGWTLEAAEQVTSDTDQAVLLSSSDVLDLLTSLVNKSLILVERKLEQETRYDMLETIRQYAGQKLWQAGEGESLRQRHLAYYVDLAERAEPNLRAPDMVKWLDRLEDEHTNIRSALEWSLEGNVEAGLRMATALLWFWHIRGHKNEGVEWLERLLSIEAMDQEGQPVTPRRAMIRGKALNASGSLMVMNHEFGRAPVRLEESLDLFKGLGTAGKQGMAHALLRLALLPSGWRSAARGERARVMLEQSLTLFREIGDKFGAAETLMQLAGMVQTSDYRQALSFAEEELALSREIGDQDGIAVALITLADLALSQDDYPQAIALYQEGLNTFRKVRNLGALSLSLGGYGDVYFWQGDYEQAAKTYEEALAFAQGIGYRFNIALNFYGLGVIAWFQGNPSKATQLISRSRPVFRDIGHHWLSVSTLHTLGDIALAEGDEERAAGWYEEELAFSREIDLAVIQILALDGLGKVAWAKGDYDLAARRFEESLRRSQEAEMRQAAFHSLCGLGRVAQSRGEYEKARACYLEALALQKRRVSPLLNWPWQKTYSTTVSYPLEALGVLAAVQNEMGRAARLFSIAEKLYTPLRFEMSAVERDEHDQAIAATRAALREGAFSAAWKEGRAMTLEQVVAYAASTN